MEILRKITIKTCGDFTITRIKEVLAAAEVAEGGSVPLLRIVGEASSAKTGQTDKGTFTKLIGQFVGTDLTTGACYQSGQCILPDFVGASLGLATQESGSVRFAFEITAKRQDTAITGYAFGIKPLIETKPTDAMTELMALGGIKPQAVALAAPETPTPAPAAEAPAPAPATGKAKK